MLPLLGQPEDVCIITPGSSTPAPPTCARRSMGNGMVRVRGDVFEQEGCRVLRSEKTDNNMSLPLS